MPPLINPTLKEAVRLAGLWREAEVAAKESYQHSSEEVPEIAPREPHVTNGMTYTAIHGGGKGCVRTVTCGADGLPLKWETLIGFNRLTGRDPEPAFRVRVIDTSRGEKWTVVVLADKPQRPLPIRLVAVAA